jgi:hypothetical protein
MAYAEVMFNTGNTTGYTDGMPIAVMGSGVLISPAELINWFQNSVVPPSISVLEPNKKAEVKRDALRTKYLAADGRTAAEAATIRFGAAYTGGTPETKANLEAQVQADIDQAILDKADYLADGYDTNWRPIELKSNGVLPVDIAQSILNDLVKRQSSTVAHPIAPRTRMRARRWRVPYENLASAPMVANLRNPSVRVDVQRQITPFTAAQIKQDL